jgi:hypothetical protein
VRHVTQSIHILNHRSHRVNDALFPSKSGLINKHTVKQVRALYQRQPPARNPNPSSEPGDTYSSVTYPTDKRFLAELNSGILALGKSLNSFRRPTKASNKVGKSRISELVRKYHSACGKLRNRLPAQAHTERAKKWLVIKFRVSSVQSTMPVPIETRRW